MSSSFSFFKRIKRILAIRAWKKSKDVKTGSPESSDSNSTESHGSGFGIVPFFIGAFIAVIITASVAMPIINSALDATIMSDGQSVPLSNISSSASTLVSFIPVVVAAGIILLFIRPVI